MWRGERVAAGGTGGGRTGGAINERSVAIDSRAARVRKERQFYGQLGDTSGLVDHRIAGLDVARGRASRHARMRAHTQTNTVKHNAVRESRKDFQTLSTQK